MIIAKSDKYQIELALRIAIDANAAAMTLYQLINKTTTIDHDEFMKLKEANTSILEKAYIK
ncbi:MAG: hypothetical protein RR588_09970 [Solibacillus sp.]